MRTISCSSDRTSEDGAEQEQRCVLNNEWA
jgi:hypothetical protein